MITDTCPCGASVTIDQSAVPPEINGISERDIHKQWIEAHAICREHPMITIEGGPIPSIDPLHMAVADKYDHSIQYGGGCLHKRVVSVLEDADSIIFKCSYCGAGKCVDGKWHPAVTP